MGCIDRESYIVVGGLQQLLFGGFDWCLTHFVYPWCLAQLLRFFDETCQQLIGAHIVLLDHLAAIVIAVVEAAAGTCPHHGCDDGCFRSHFLLLSLAMEIP